MRNKETETLGTGAPETGTSRTETALQPVEPTDRGVAVANGYEESVESGFVQDLNDA